VIKAFLKFCEENGWQAAMMMPDEPDVYNQYGFPFSGLGRSDY